MPKTIKKYLVYQLTKVKLRYRKVRIFRNCYISGVTFKGTATIEPSCRLIGDDKITIGENFYLNVGCHLLGEIEIGNDVLIGPQTVIWGRDHGVKRGQLIRLQKHVKKKISISDDVWIGANVTILKGIYIGKGAVIAAGSVVTKNVQDYHIVAGNPARKISERKVL